MGDENAVDLSEDVMELSSILKTVDGTAFAYSQLDCISKKIGSVKVLEAYVHLQKINMSNNLIFDVTPVKHIPYLLSMNVSSNKVRSIECLEDHLQYLISMNLSNNKLTKLTPLTMPTLKKVNLSGNQIATCEEFGGHQTIEVLDISDNLLQDLSGLQNMPNLVTLTACRNQIKSLKARPNEEFTPEPFLTALGSGSATGEAPASLDDPKLMQYMWDAVDGNAPAPWIVTITKVDGNMATLAGEAPIQLQIHQDEVDKVAALLADAGEGDGIVGTIDCTRPQVETQELDALDSLQTLDMSENQLRGLVGLGKCAPQVSSLKLSANDLGSLDRLTELGALGKLKNLDISAELGGEAPKKNSVVDVDSFRLELLISNPQLGTIDDTEVAEDERTGAQELQYKREHPDED
jgi:Leucine-rich repeat (LRR) protein